MRERRAGLKEETNPSWFYFLFPEDLRATAGYRVRANLGEPRTGCIQSRGRMDGAFSHE